MVMPGRNFTNGDQYRYGFNGQEKDDDVASGLTTAMYWEYDSRIGRRWNVDPVVKVWESPYLCFGGNPILFSDVNGDDWYRKGDDFKWFKGSKEQKGYTNVGKSHRYISINKTIVTLSENKEGTKGFWSEEKPRDEYEKAIINGKYYYTSNYGWVDKTHAFSTTSRENIGTQNLWNNILNETGEKSNVQGGGFRLKYGQDAKVGPFRPGFFGDYFVSSNLNIDQKQKVAMSILLEVSYNFEKFQGLHPTSSSSFEISDMPSNALGLYKAMYNLSRSEVENLIQPLSPLQSIDVYRQYPNTFSTKNKTFRPVLFPNNYSPKDAQIPALFKGVGTIKKSMGQGGIWFDWHFTEPNGDFHDGNY